MAYEHIYVLPDQSVYSGGEIWDRYGNLEYFADVSALSDKASTGGADSAQEVSGHSRKPYLNAKVRTTVKNTTRYVTTGISQPKGAIPGYTITLVSGPEKRQFQTTATISAIYAWLKTTAKVDVTLYGPTGSPKDPIKAVSEALVL